MKERLQESWFQYLPENQKAQVQLCFDLYERELELNSDLSDYSFIIFPLAKVYEGFLKVYFYNLGLIDDRTYSGTRFRVGRSLNPDISHARRDEYWIYDDVANICGKQLARQLWDTWLKCRNRIFHYFPQNNTVLTLTKVKQYMEEIVDAIDAAIACEIEEKRWEKNTPLLEN